MRCSFCAFWSDGAAPPEELTLAQIERLSAKLARLGSLIISVEGGEPMLRPDIVEIVAALARHHHPVLYTNGWHVDGDRAKALFDAGIVGVGLSLDYATAEKHDAHRLPGSFDRVMRAVEHFRRVAPRGRRRVHLVSVLMEDNRDDLEPLLRISRDLGIRHMVTLLAVGGYNRASGKEQPRVDRSALTPWLLDLKRKYPHFIDLTEYLSNMDDYLHGRYTKPCQAGTPGFNVNHVGQTNPCIELTNVSVGHVLEVPDEELVRRLRTVPQVRDCQKCYTICRGNVQAVGGGRIASIRELLS
jgi:MoaA/NifB/PqqE/SkfB family radical SAM enzyme